MLANIHLLRFNNYYNRMLKIKNNLREYEEDTLGVIPGVNFNPNDGISTKQIINWQGDIPDYILVVINEEITGRWFVIESKRLLTGQFELQLYRDTLADYYNEIQAAPIFVEKGMLEASNPLIFNQEDMTFNQIRQAPTLLKDVTGIPWIVGYIPSNADLDNKTISANYNASGNIDYEVDSISNWEYSKYLEYPGYVNYNYYTIFRYIQQELNNENVRKNIAYGMFPNNDYSNYFKEESKYYQGTTTDEKFLNTYEYDGKASTSFHLSKSFTSVEQDAQYNSYLSGYIASKYDILSEENYIEINSLKGKVIKDTSSGDIFEIDIIENYIEIEDSLKNEQSMTGRLTTLIPKPLSGEITDYTFTYMFKGYEIKISLKQVQVEISANLSNDRIHLEDESYDMFCIPFGKILLFETQEGFRSQNIGTALATKIGELLGANAIYDIQLLPYCPIQYLWDDEYNYIDLTRTKYSIIKDENNKKISALIWCKKSNFNFNIEYRIPDINNAIEKKLASQTNIYRLISSNGNGIFEFNPYKNGGIDYFRVDCSYKPFNPYIRIAPIFKELYGYGGQYDYRGLILGGDFSITQLSNAWANYQLQNKNYQNIFDRQIQHMEVQNKYSRINELVNAATGSVTGAVTGAIAGSMAGPYGAAAGAAVGGTLSTAGGIADFALNEMLRNEAIDYTKDNFGYQLGNIQAIPSSISKTTALNINNSLIPMLEIYKCTEEEKEAFRNKIIYNGMTVMVIGNISQFTEGYFKGKLIRLEGISDDYHVVNVIAKELNKGVYLT